MAGPSQPPAVNPSQSFLQYQAVSNPEPSAGPGYNNFIAQGPNQFLDSRGGHQSQRGGRGAHDQRQNRHQPTDKPKSKHAIPGCEPWILVHTKLGRRFVYNSEKNQSFWRIPDKLKNGILKLDQQRIKEKAEALMSPKETKEPESAPRVAELEGPETKPQLSSEKHVEPPLDGDDSSEYEEVEVTDDEDDESNPKRQRTGEPGEEDPVEFNEDDIAWQLAAMGQEHGLAPGEYDDGHMDEWEEGVEGIELTYEDSSALFKDLLNDYGINPYSPWEKLIEEGKLVDDTRYTALPNMKARKEVWEEWSREKIKILRDQRAKEEKKDPRIPYLAFLQNNATPKLYWPEFKRKFRKDPEMRDATLSDKDREKSYREHINRMKLPQSTLKSDFLNLLKAQPISVLNNSTLPSHLPAAVIADIKYISLDPATRDPLVESFISTLPPAPEAGADDENEETIKERSEKQRRQKALDDRERQVAEEKRRQRRNLEAGKGRLREEEAEIARAMNVTRKGLKGHLVVEGDDEASEVTS